MHHRSRWEYIVWCIWFIFVASLLCANSTINFTSEEVSFIENHKEIHIGVDPKFVPFEFLDKQGAYSGIAADVLDIISSRTGLIFKNNPDLNWVETIEQAKNRTIDLLPIVGYTEERAQYLTFLKPYLQFQRTIVVQESNTSIKSFADLKGRQVAVQKNSSHEGFLQFYPEISLRLYDTVEEALLAVNLGNEIAFIGNEATNSYLSRSLGITGLKFIAFSEGGTNNLHMAVRSDWPQLVSILQKSLDSISEKELSTILHRWIYYDEKIDYTPIIRIIVIISFLVLLIFGISSFWIIRLKKVVKEKEQAKEHAQLADMEKSRFLARISHEVRTPLNAIKGMSYLLDSTPLNSMQSRYLQAVKGATHTMQVIINDILEYSRLEDGRVVLEKIPFIIDDVLQNTISVDSWMIRQKGLDFHLVQDDSVPQFLIGDPTRITQILTNLLHNSVKFTSVGFVKLSIRVHQMDRQSCVLLFQVRDSGVGMNEEQLQNIFRPFIQANDSINRKYGGSGLGLSIVKDLVEVMQGSIEVTSEVDKGSTFSVKLPLLIDVEKVEADIKRKKAIDFSSVRALIILKDPLLIVRLNTMFDEYHINYDSVSSINLASQILKGENSYDLCVIELEDYPSLPEVFSESISSLGQDRPKILVFVHDDTNNNSEDKIKLDYDLILPLPMINSLLFNALLQLFGEGSEPSSESKVSEDTSHPHPVNVLVVEDNHTNQIIAQELLEHTGATVFVANNGKEGYEIFLEKESLLDVILMDLHMEIMDGYEATRLIREKNPSIPILILSADLIDSVRQKCYKLGATDIIGKPFEPDYLIQKVYEVGLSYVRPNQILDSINFELGVDHMGGDKNLYKVVLSSFIIEYSQLVETLRKSIKKKDSKLVAELAHKGKGSCGSIGAMKAQNLCIILQKQCEHNPDQFDEQSVLSLIKELESVLKQASEYTSQ